MRLKLCENMRAVPYVPFYLALAGGYWESEGLDTSRRLAEHVAHGGDEVQDTQITELTNEH
jgi:hypothetical protein